MLEAFMSLVFKKTKIKFSHFSPNVVIPGDVIERPFMERVVCLLKQFPPPQQFHSWEHLSFYPVLRLSSLKMFFFNIFRTFIFS